VGIGLVSATGFRNGRGPANKQSRSPGRFARHGNPPCAATALVPFPFLAGDQFVFVPDLVVKSIKLGNVSPFRRRIGPRPAPSGDDAMAKAEGADPFVEPERRVSY
jgi:hypothetical protein